MTFKVTKTITENFDLSTVLPDPTGQSAGQAIVTDGSGNYELGSSGLPSQTGQSGNFLTTNGSSASWASVSGASLPVVSGADNGDVLTVVSGAWAKAAPAGVGNMSTSTYDPAAIAQQVVGTTATQTLTNKTLTAPVISSISNSGTLTLPSGADTLVGRATTDTLTNKTLTTPNITGITNGSNAASGSVGEAISVGGFALDNTVTISNASPAVISDNDGNITVGSVINFNTTGSLPTGISAGTNYYVIASGFSSGVSYQISATPAGTAVNTSSAGSGTHTRHNYALLSSNTLTCAGAITLSAGDWDIYPVIGFSNTGSTTQFYGVVSTTNGSLTGLITRTQILDNTTHSSGASPQSPVGAARVNPSTLTTYYLNVRSVFSAGSSLGNGDIMARRVR